MRKIKIKKGWNECVDLEGGGGVLKPKSGLWLFQAHHGPRSARFCESFPSKVNLYGRYQ
jgi:hypothetical protein